MKEHSENNNVGIFGGKKLLEIMGVLLCCILQNIAHELLRESLATRGLQLGMPFLLLLKMEDSCYIYVTPNLGQQFCCQT